MLTGGNVEKASGKPKSERNRPPNPTLQLKTVFNQRVVQKASFRSPEFIGFFAPISENRGGPLATGN